MDVGQGMAAQRLLAFEQPMHLRVCKLCSTPRIARACNMQQ